MASKAIGPAGRGYRAQCHRCGHRQAADGNVTVRQIAMEPAGFIGERVKIVGQFRGRNLYGDVPQDRASVSGTSCCVPRTARSG
jgi:hypothetical protein